MATSSITSDQNNVKSRRPAESAFKQQRLPAWQPILTAGTVLPTFFVIGIAFIPVGIGLLYFSDEVKEHTIDYTQCVKKGDTITCTDYIKQMQAKVVANQTSLESVEKCICELDFNLTEDFKAEVYLYYGLSNYYQNHRRYVKSRDDNQLLGRLNLPLSTDCDPFSKAYENGVKKPVAPCGAIANSLFNDTLTLYSKEQDKAVPVLRTGIAWNSDKDIKFRNPDTSGVNGSLKAAFVNYTKPANWVKHVWELDLEDPDNNGFQNEDLIVWMRTAALPTFRKLYRRVNHDIDGFRTGLNKGLYMLSIEYNYPVTDFDGTKSFIISTTSLLGGKNPFLGVAYVVVGTLCLLLGIVLLIIHVRCSKRMPTSAETFILDHESNTGLKVKPNVQKLGVDDILDVQPPAPPTSAANDPIQQGAETQNPQLHLKTVNEMPEEKLSGDNLQTHKDSGAEQFPSAGKQASGLRTMEKEVTNKGDTTQNVPKKLSVIETDAEPSSSAYPRGRLQESDEPPHSILHSGGAWSHAKQRSTLRINEPKDLPERSSSARDTRQLRDSLGRSSGSELTDLSKRRASRSELTDLKKGRVSDEISGIGLSRSELTAAKRRASISAVKLKLSPNSRDSKQLEASASAPAPAPAPTPAPAPAPATATQVSVETLAKTDTVTTGTDTSSSGKPTLESDSDNTLKPMSSNADKPESDAAEKDKQNKKK